MAIGGRTVAIIRASITVSATIGLIALMFYRDLCRSENKLSKRDIQPVPIGGKYPQTIKFLSPIGMILG